MIDDPEARGRALAELFLDAGPALFLDLEASGALGPDADVAQAREEWECFALYACVRGLVAAGGFNRETGAAIDALHAAVIEAWGESDPDSIDARRARIAERYAEYGAIGQEHGAAGAATVTERLGRAAARHMAPRAPEDFLAEVAGHLHEELSMGAAESVRTAT